ncbi:MAG: PAC2 family protein [Chloroflexi bacterium]|nr:PAC2 family protein [Chloroflexota bacterium]
MDELLELSEKPVVEETYMIAGWRQWADAGNVSSGLPQYLIDETHARKIGEIRSDPFYLFQIPGAQHFLRPEVKMQEGYRVELKARKNEFYYSGDSHKGLVIFLGDEPHLNVERYAQTLFGAASELGVKRVAAIGGVYAPVPYSKDRQISCSYSLPQLKSELDEYAVQFSSYEGGVSIGTFLADQAERLGIEYIVFYPIVPMYDFSQLFPLVEAITIGNDSKAWFDVMRRLNYMFKLGIDLADLEQRSRELIRSVASQIDALEQKVPQAQVREYMDKVNAGFTEMSFMPLDDAWEAGLKDLFEDPE